MIIPFTDEEVEGQRLRGTHPKSSCWKVVASEFKKATRLQSPCIHLPCLTASSPDVRGQVVGSSCPLRYLRTVGKRERTQVSVLRMVFLLFCFGFSSVFNVWCCGWKPGPGTW
jgi:hypothetical protein